MDELKAKVEEQAATIATQNNTLLAVMTRLAELEGQMVRTTVLEDKVRVLEDNHGILQHECSLICRKLGCLTYNLAALEHRVHGATPEAIDLTGSLDDESDSLSEASDPLRDLTMMEEEVQERVAEYQRQLDEEEGLRRLREEMQEGHALTPALPTWYNTDPEAKGCAPLPGMATKFGTTDSEEDTEGEPVAEVVVIKVEDSEGEEEVEEEEYEEDQEIDTDTAAAMMVQAYGIPPPYSQKPVCLIPIEDEE
jgi:hypothetical protein